METIFSKTTHWWQYFQKNIPIKTIFFLQKQFLKKKPVEAKFKDKTSGGNIFKKTNRGNIIKKKPFEAIFQEKNYSGRAMYSQRT